MSVSGPGFVVCPFTIIFHEVGRISSCYTSQLVSKNMQKYVPTDSVPSGQLLATIGGRVCSSMERPARICTYSV